jgi:Fanconi anemia group M protein
MLAPPTASPSHAPAPAPRWRLDVDYREAATSLFSLVRACSVFDVQLRSLVAGDYLIADQIVVERKTYADFAISIVDGRLFHQAARLARTRWRPLLLVEGPKPPRTPGVHPHALKGAVLSLAVGWRLPVIFSRSTEESLRLLKMLGDQSERLGCLELPRQGYRPKRLQTRKLYVLQGLPGVGPTIARRLLERFGTIRNVIEADEEDLAAVRGCGPKRAAAIQALIRS